MTHFDYEAVDYLKLQKYQIIIINLKSESKFKVVAYKAMNRIVKYI